MHIVIHMSVGFRYPSDESSRTAVLNNMMAALVASETFFFYQSVFDEQETAAIKQTPGKDGLFSLL